MKQTTLIISKKSSLASVLEDACSVCLLGFAFWFNYKFIGGSYVVNALILIFFILKLLMYADDDDVFYIHKVSDEEIDAIIKLVENK